MAFAHVYFDDQKPHGRMLRRMLQMSEEADELMAKVRGAMIQMRDGDGRDPAHYVEVASRFGFPSNQKAKEAFEELDSAYSKTSGNDTVTNVRAARDQLYNKMR